jgi:UDPglucose--hexose-1-phosphate uridylyltransferase
MNGASDSEPRTVVDPTTGRPILLAPRRQQRPMHTGPHANRAACPFCAGNERETPPEVAAVRPPHTQPDGPGWTARAFPNKYPANAHHEVIAEGGEHSEQPTELGVAVWRDSLQLCRDRVRALEARTGVACAYWFKNVGASAGASIAHNHSQLLGLPELPPRLELERRTAHALARCPWCATLARAEAEQRLVFRSAQHAVVVPDPPKLPHETWLLPVQCDDDFLATDLDSLAHALHALFVAIAHGLQRPAFNLWLHRVPRERFHWHFELQPRTGQMAGLELGGDMYINAVPAATSAQRLRAGLAAAGLVSG